LIDLCCTEAVAHQAMDGYMKQQGRRKNNGFTLIELIMTAAIAVTIGGITSSGIESTKYWLEPKRLFSAIQETRTLSITHNEFAVLCPSEDSFVCEKDWQLPLIIFIDFNDNKKRDINENLIHTITPYTNLERTIKYPRRQIRFNGQGQINGYTGTLKYCSKYASKGMVLSRVGRIRYLQQLATSRCPPPLP
jgi:prepilin-type N-terminal cleavage/methylation domain-containing protein